MGFQDRRVPRDYSSPPPTKEIATLARHGWRQASIVERTPYGAPSRSGIRDGCLTRSAPARDVLLHAVALSGSQAQPVRWSESLSDAMSSSHQLGPHPCLSEHTAKVQSSENCSLQYWSSQRTTDKYHAPQRSGKPSPPSRRWRRLVMSLHSAATRNSVK